MERFGEEEVKAVEQVIRSGKLSRFFQDFNGGPHVQAFEHEFANYIGSKHAISIANGTVALEIALASLNLKKGDEVITTPLTFIATATAILRVGAKPVFIDIDPETLNMDECLVEEHITKRTKAILSVSLLGKPAEVYMLKTIAKDYHISLVEDAAQALGARYYEKKIGTCGSLGCFSFQETKTITTGGEGGMIVTDDDNAANMCRHIRNHGNVYGNIQMEIPCTNARMTECQAVFGRIQLRKLEDFIRIQRLNAKILFNRIKPPLRPVYTDVVSTYYLVPFYLCSGSLLTRDQFIAKCTAAGLNQGLPGQNIGYYKKLVYEHPIFQKYKRRCPNAEWVRDNIILFDIHRWNKTPQNMKEYAETINQILTSS